jgi:hypothetical protein
MEIVEQNFFFHRLFFQIQGLISPLVELMLQITELQLFLKTKSQTWEGFVLKTKLEVQTTQAKKRNINGMNIIFVIVRGDIHCSNQKNIVRN